jgi:adenylate cyclase
MSSAAPHPARGLKLARSTRSVWLTAAVCAGLVAILALTIGTRAVEQADLRVQDALLRATTTERLPENFLLVALDDDSLQLGTLEPEEIANSQALQMMKKGFPWSREVYGMAVEKILEAGARVVVLDFTFASENPGDAKFAEILQKYPGRVVLASAFDLKGPEGQIAASLRLPVTPLAHAVGENIGFANLSDTDVVRHMRPFARIDSWLATPQPDDLEVTPALATVAARLLGREFRENPTRPLRFRYADSSALPAVPLLEIFVPDLWKSNLRAGQIFRDKVVMIGPTAEGLKDFHRTPLGRMAGPIVHLNFLSALLRDSWLTSPGPAVALGSMFAAAALALLLALARRSAVVFLAGLVAGTLVWVGLCFLALIVLSVFLPVVPALLTWLACGFLVLATDATLERRERQRIRQTFERYVSRDVVREIMDNPESYLNLLGGERKEVVTLMSDLQGFTAEAEALDPSRMVTLLNAYFGEMVEVIFARSGMLDKFMGDAIMATWGGLTSVSPQEDARQAVRAAFQLREKLEDFNRHPSRSARPWRSGIGITQGPVVFGNIGCEEKMDITVIGDTVNLAARIEGLTRVYRCDILLDNHVAENVRGEFDLLLVDTVRVKGRQRAESLHFPYRAKDGDAAWVDAFAHARADYLDRNFAAAGEVFTRLSSGGVAPGVAAVYAERCAAFLQVAPPADWDGVWDFESK